MRRSYLSLLALAFSLLVPSATALASDQYEYDAAGRITRVTYHTGQIVDYGYDGNSNVTSIISSLATAVDPTPQGRVFVNALGASEPNPASREARLRFSLARTSKATLRFFDVQGRLIQTVADRRYPAGEFAAQVVVSKWPAGVYFYKLELEGFTATRRLIVLR